MSEAIALSCTLFDDVRAQTKQELTWSAELVDQNITWLKKESCPLVKLALFGDTPTAGGSLRSNQNVRAITGAEGDYDGEAFAIEDAVSLFEQTSIEAVFYTSASYTSDKPRWRILLPFSKPYEGTQAEMKAWRTQALRKAESIIGTTFEPESYALSQSYYVGPVKGADFQCYHCEGVPIDTGLEFAPIETTETAPAVVQTTADTREAEYLLQHIPPDCGYHAWLNVGMALKHQYGDEGFALWDTWSAKGDKYDGSLTAKWQSFSGEGITFATLAAMAKDNGADLRRFSTGDMGLIIPEGANVSPVFPDIRLLKNAEARVLATIDNLRALMTHYNIEARYNLIHKRIYVSGIACLPGEEENALFAELMSKAALNGMPDKGLSPYLDRVAQLNAYNPVTDYLESLGTLGGDPIPLFIERCGFSRTEWATVAWRRWFIQAVAAADHGQRSINPYSRPEFPYVLVIAGDQGLTKTALMYELLPSPIRDCFTAGRMLDTNKRDSIFEAVQNWVVELGEIDSTFRKSDIAALKAFLTNQVDSVRMPYARSWSHIPRRTAFMATVNQLRFLQDATGNRRFWPVVVQEKIPPITEGMAKAIWAWAWDEYLSGEQWWLTPEEEMLHARIVAGHEDRPLRERLLDCYDFTKTARNVLVCSTDILREITWSMSDRSATTALGVALRDLGVVRDESKRLYRMPPRTGANAYNL